jgi:hypothetical protein
MSYPVSYSQLTPDNILELIRKGSLDLSNGYNLTLDNSPDECWSIDECETYGKVQWSRSRQRPHGFDGSAEVLDRSRGSRLWWQPYREGKQVYKDCRSAVCEILEYGFYVYTVSLHGPAVDGAGNCHEVCLATDSIGAIKPLLTDVELLPIIEDLLVNLFNLAIKPLSR